MNRLLLLCLSLLCLPLTGWTCTSIIITGKATPDGRPLMWKHRDTGAPYNHIAYFNEGGYRFLGLVNSGDSTKAVWAGTNETGFSIMNTASYNLEDNKSGKRGYTGQLMRKALNVCATVDDFTHFLDTLSRPMWVEANFGVIDARGGAAYFETNSTRYYKKDANDPALAPDGYLIYTNFSFEGRPDGGKGYVRYENARKIFSEMRAEGLTPRNIFRRASRSFYNSLLDIDLKQADDSPNQRSGWFVEQDFIPRLESTASIVIQGVRPDMRPELTTMWTALGYPPCSVALPLWVSLGEEQCALTRYDENYKTAPMDWLSNRLQEKVYPIHRGNGKKYLHWQLLWNESGTGYIQRLDPVEERIFALFDARKAAWESAGQPDPATVRKLYAEAERMIREAYEGL